MTTTGRWNLGYIFSGPTINGSGRSKLNAGDAATKIRSDDDLMELQTLVLGDVDGNGYEDLIFSDPNLTTKVIRHTPAVHTGTTAPSASNSTLLTIGVTIGVNDVESTLSVGQPSELSAAGYAEKINQAIQGSLLKGLVVASDADGYLEISTTAAGADVNDVSLRVSDHAILGLSGSLTSPDFPNTSSAITSGNLIVLNIPASDFQEIRLNLKSSTTADPATPFALGDLNNDGYDDFALFDQNPGPLDVYYGGANVTSQSTLGALLGGTINSLIQPLEITAGDFDGDDAVDLAIGQLDQYNWGDRIDLFRHRDNPVGARKH